MKFCGVSFVMLSMLIVSGLADKLQNNYLPPITATTAGGAELLTAPSRISNSFAARYRSNVPFSTFNSRYYDRSYNGVPIERANTAFRNIETFASGPQIPILRLTNDNNGEGSYRFAYETDNSIIHEEEGHQENFSGSEPGTVVRGAYSYQSPEGQILTVNYIADENGFRATGDHLPTAPPVPEAIQRSLNLNLATSQNLVDDTGAYNRNSEASDLDTVEVGRPVSNGIDRHYLSPLRSSNYGYRY